MKFEFARCPNCGLAVSRRRDLVFWEHVNYCKLSDLLGVREGRPTRRERLRRYRGRRLA